METNTIHNCTALQLIDKLEPNSVDLILTDPPYPQEYIPLYGDLAKLAVHALKPGGSCLAMASNAWMLEILQQMNIPGLKYNWLIHFGPFTTNTACLPRHVCMVRFKLFLWHIKPPMKRDNGIYIEDSVQGSKIDKRYHDWGQEISNSQELIRRFKVPKDGLICDPFVGGGTNAEAAASLGIPFVGCDIDEKCVEVSKQRLKSHQIEML